MEAILKQMGVEQPKAEVDFELKESVKVKEGPFANFVGSIEEIQIDKQKAESSRKYVRT